MHTLINEGKAWIETKRKEQEEEIYTSGNLIADVSIHRKSDFHSDYSNLLIQNFTIISDFLERIECSFTVQSRVVYTLEICTMLTPTLIEIFEYYGNGPEEFNQGNDHATNNLSKGKEGNETLKTNASLLSPLQYYYNMEKHVIIVCKIASRFTKMYGEYVAGVMRAPVLNAVDLQAEERREKCLKFYFFVGKVLKSLEAIIRENDQIGVNYLSSSRIKASIEVVESCIALQTEFTDVFA